MQVDIQDGSVVLKRSGSASLALVTINTDQIEPVVDCKPEMGHLFSAGRRYTWRVKAQEGLEGEIWLSAFPSQDFILIGGCLKATGAEPVYVSDFHPCTVRVLRDMFDDARVYLNSGFQGFAGSLSLTDPRTVENACTEITAVQGKAHEDCLGVGFVSLRRTVGCMMRSLEDGDLCVRPLLYYGGVRLDPGDELRLETLMLNTSLHGACACLEQWVDVCVSVIQPKFNRSLAHGSYNAWYAYWTPDSSFAGEKVALLGADELEQSGLIHYGITEVSAGILHNQAAFSEEKLWPGLFPHGQVWLSEQVGARGMGLTGGQFHGLVSECATVFQEHPEWMVRDEDGNPKRFADISWGACPSPCYAMDFTIPEAVVWFRKVVEAQAEWGCKYFAIDFFANGQGRQEGWFRLDEKVLGPFESLRLMPKIVREALGEDCIIATFSSPTNALVGTVDRVRLAADCGALEPSPNVTAKLMDGGKGNVLSQETVDKRWNWVKQVARDMAAGYFYHGKFWMNDPDPPMVGLTDNMATLEEARVRLMLCADSGGFPTIGEAISHQSPVRQAMLKKWLPVHGQAARTVDLMKTEFPSIRHLHFAHPSGGYDVLSIYNWENEPKTFSIDLDELGLPGSYHVFEFWDQDYTGTTTRRLEYTVPARAVRVVRLSLVTGVPQIIGTDRHVAMGIQELPHIAWSDRDSTLSGIALRPLPEYGYVRIAVPEGWEIQSAKGLDVTEAGEVITGATSFDPDGHPWQLKFRKRTQALGL